MPITTERLQAAFPEVAVIRKGGAKQKTMKNEREVETLGVDLKDRFRIVFHPGVDQSLITGFQTAYGSLQPTVIRAVLPFRDAVSNWEAWNEAYSAGRLIARADGDHYISKRNPNTGAYEVIHEEPHTPWSPRDVITYERNGRSYNLKFKPTGRLKLFLPYTIRESSTRIVHFTLKTTSFYDCLNIEQNLLAVQGVADVLNSGNCAGIPIIISRREAEIPRSMPDGSAQRVKKWLVYIEVDPEWTAQMMNRMKLLASGQNPVLPALPAPAVPVTLPDPPAGLFEDEDEDDDDLEPEEYTREHAQATEAVFTPAISSPIQGGAGGGVKSEKIDAAVPQNKPAVTQSPPPAGYEKSFYRPAGALAPAELKTEIERLAKAYESKPISDGKRGLIAPTLEKCFAVADAPSRRHDVQKYLTGKASLKDIPDAYLIALYLWLNPQKDSGGDFTPDPIAAKEAASVFAAAHADNPAQATLLDPEVEAQIPDIFRK